jgi:predicted nucleotidyltransferase component of viral defense system
MIDMPTIKKLAQESAQSSLFLEREYILIGILLSLGGIPQTRKKLLLKGVTALRHAYFRDWRFSDSLHFATEEKLEAKDLQTMLTSLLDRASSEFGFRFQVSERYFGRRKAHMQIAYVGPLRQSCLLNLRLSLHETLTLPSRDEEILVVPFPLKTRKVKVFSLEEVLAETLRDLLLNGEPEDFYDSWRILTQHAALINREDFMLALTRKCEQAGFDLESAQDFLEQELLAPTRAYWRIRLANQVVDLPTFDEAYADLAAALPPFFVIPT